MKKEIYLKTTKVEDALKLVINELERDKLIKKETIKTATAVGRVSAASVFAKYSSPTFHSAAMDGVCTKAKKTFSARETNPVTLRKDKDYIPINTGNPIPSNMDAVIMVENIVQKTKNTIEIFAPVFPYNNIRKIGEDIVATELIIPTNKTLTAYDVGALLTAGIWEIEVWEKVKIAFIPSGNEILNFKNNPKPKIGEVIESNSQILSSLCKLWDINFTLFEIVPDDETKIQQKVREVLKSDFHIVVVGAGSSAGSKDFTKKVFEEIGKVLVYGVSVMPGKPTILGKAGDKLLMGAPGYPVSAVIAFENILSKIVFWLSRKKKDDRKKIKVKITKKVTSKLGFEEVVRLSVAKIGRQYIGVPLKKGAGTITSLTKAQAITKIPINSEGINESEKVEAELLVPEKELGSVLIHIGSHDNILDTISDMLMQQEEPIYMVSNNVGSMGGLIAVKQNACMFSGTHLFDPETSDFNFPFIKKYLPDVKFKLINLVIRNQGLIVPKGNPKNIKNFKDLKRKDVRFINRQKGSGTRILLDYHLKKEKISEKEIAGYDKEEYTHMAVAANVLTGIADCGLGILAAAEALNLDFIPCALERYDLFIPQKFFNTKKIQALLNLIKSKEFKQKVKKQKGYDISLTGKEMKEGFGLGK